jgi:hypothetical protein
MGEESGRYVVSMEELPVDLSLTFTSSQRKRPSFAYAAMTKAGVPHGAWYVVLFNWPSLRINSHREADDLFSSTLFNIPAASRTHDRFFLANSHQSEYKFSSVGSLLTSWMFD